MAVADLRWRAGKGLYLMGSHTLPDGTRKRRAQHVEGDDPELGAEMLRALRHRFAVGDLSWLDRGRGRAAGRPAAGAPAGGGELAAWADHWLERIRPPEVEEGTWRNYRAHVRAIQAALPGYELGAVTLGVVHDLRRRWRAGGSADRTVDSRIGTLRLVLLDARAHGRLATTPFDAPIRRPRTKRRRAAAGGRRVTFAPFTLEELEALLEKLREPQSDDEARQFPLTEALLLTGLRWGEVAAWIWPDVSRVGRRVRVERAVPKYGTLALAQAHDAPTKTGQRWEIPLRDPLAGLLARQRQRSYVGRPEGWIFPGARGGHLHYANWLRRAWGPLLLRAKVQPRERDAQKALRRTWITTALVCGMSPKQVSAEVGHTTPRMVLEVYDSFLDPSRWPREQERRRLAELFGFELQGQAASAGSAAGASQGNPRATRGNPRRVRRRRRRGEG